MQRFVGLLTIFGLLAGACGSTEEAATTVPVSTTATASTKTTTTVHVDTTAPSTTTTTVAAPAAFSSGAFPVPFSIVKPANHGLKQSTNFTNDIFYLEGRSGSNMYLLLTIRGPATLDDWRAAEAGQAITLSEVPQNTTIGGLPATYLEFNVQDSHPVPGELETFQFEVGDIGRVYMVDVNGEAITILAIAAPDLWTDFQSVVDELLGGLTWK
ncbi:MAG: hypothetical protein JJE47_07265 [Acidimicrobiia bacterium]|nr:hypothetical protein [Acidimicrobiia bacterium]